MDWKKMLIALTGAAEDASDEALLAAFEAKLKASAAEPVEALSSQVTALSEQVEALKPTQGAEAELTALSTTVASLKDELSVMANDVLSMRRQAVCDAAAREGKVIPLSAEQIAATDPQVLSEMAAKLSPTVPVDQRTPDKVTALSAAASGAIEKVARLCGLDPQKVKEVNKG